MTRTTFTEFATAAAREQLYADIADIQRSLGNNYTWWLQQQRSAYTAYMIEHNPTMSLAEFADLRSQ